MSKRRIIFFSIFNNEQFQYLAMYTMRIGFYYAML